MELADADADGGREVLVARPHISTVLAKCRTILAGEKGRAASLPSESIPGPQRLGCSLSRRLDTPE